MLSSLGLPGWFRRAYFEYHSSVRLRFKLAAGLGQPWTRDGGIPQGCPLSTMFIVALYLPWCGYLSAMVGVRPQLYADNLKCVSGDPGVLLRAARFTTGYVRLVGQEPAPCKCVFLSTSRVVRREMRDWVVTDEGARWTVKFDVRDLGGHLDTTYRGWSSTLAKRVRVVLARLLVVFALLFIFMVGCVNFGICLFMVLCMVLRLPSWLSLVFESCGLLFAGCLGLVGSLWLMWVLFSVC